MFTLCILIKLFLCCSDMFFGLCVKPRRAYAFSFLFSTLCRHTKTPVLLPCFLCEASVKNLNLSTFLSRVFVSVSYNLSYLSVAFV